MISGEKIDERTFQAHFIKAPPALEKKDPINSEARVKGKNTDHRKSRPFPKR